MPHKTIGGVRLKLEPHYKKVAAETGYSMASVKEAVIAVIASAIEQTQTHGSSKLEGYLVFKHKTAICRPPGRWKNPRTGEISQMPARHAKKTVSIHPTAKFKALMNAEVG